jgi:hypothetical protein
LSKSFFPILCFLHGVTGFEGAADVLPPIGIVLYHQDDVLFMDSRLFFDFSRFEMGISPGQLNPEPGADSFVFMAVGCNRTVVQLDNFPLILSVPFFFFFFRKFLMA